jgi:hypothetical protein
MTATDLGGGSAPLFMGAYVRNISTSLGISSSPSNMTVTLVEDVPNGIVFSPPTMGTFVELTLGSGFNFGGIFQKYNEDVRNISGRQIRVTVNDARQAMSAIPMILAPGFQAIANTINSSTNCSVLDVFGAFGASGINISGYTEAGIIYDKIRQAIEGDTIPISADTNVVIVLRDIQVQHWRSK